MNIKNIIISGILGGIVLSIVSFIAQVIGTAIAPYNIFDIGGMRPITDPISTLFFVYPFVFAFMAAIVYSWVGSAVIGSDLERGIKFGALLFVIYTIPSLFVIYSSMDYPRGFFISNFISSIVGYPLLGIIFVKVLRE